MPPPLGSVGPPPSNPVHLSVVNPLQSGGPPGTGAQGEDLYTLEAEITELQRENARVESQVLRLRSDITAMENQLKQGDKVSSSITPPMISERAPSVRDPSSDKPQLY